MCVYTVCIDRYMCMCVYIYIYIHIITWRGTAFRGSSWSPNVTRRLTLYYIIMLDYSIL